MHAELVQVRIGDADVGSLRTGVRHLDGKVPRQLMLDRQVPVLRITGAEVAVYREDSLAQARVGCEGNRLDVRAIGQHECGSDIVERAL